MAKEKKKCKKCNKELSFLDTCKLDGDVYCEKCFKIVKGDKKGKAKTKVESKEKSKEKSEESKADENIKENPKKKTKAVKPIKSAKTKSKLKLNQIDIKWVSAILYIAALYLIYVSIIKVDISNIDLTITENIGIMTKSLVILLEGLVLIVIASMIYILGSISEKFKINQELMRNQIKELIGNGANIAQAPINNEDLDEMLKKELDALELEKIEIKPGQEEFTIEESEELDFDLEEDFLEEEIIIIDEDDEIF